MAAQAEHLRISQVGLAARSPEGHAAKGGMAIKGNEDMWVHIQANTFRNWVNEHLKTVGLVVRDLATDFSDGTKLVALVEILQKRQLRHIKRPANPHQYLENVTTALNAVAEDGVKLVNIGNVDIVNGNLKLILGLIWSLIVRYQIGRSKFPPKKLMLAWLKAVLPECRVTNFTSDWNSGVCLSALLDYCRPGLFSHWRQLDEEDGVNNCRRAMEIARREFGIPLVLEPEYLASPHLDELSGMTYLSYFMKEDSPGFHATLRWVNSQLPETNVKNFTRDWNSGVILCNLVRSLGGPVPGYKQLTSDQSSWENNLSLGIKGGQKLGVEPILKAKDMADQNVEHLGVMAYAAHFQWIRPRQQPSERLAAHWTQHTSRIHKSAQFKIECLEGDVNPQDVVAEVVGPSGKVDCRLNMSPTGGHGNFTPTEVGMYQLFVYCEGELIQGCPTSLRIMPDVTTISYPGMEPCAIGSIVEVLVNSNGANAGQIDVVARSPTGRELNCPVNERDGVYTANFQPDEAGEWRISITHGGENIQGGPYTCFVFDPNGIKLTGLDGGQPGQSHSFVVDTSGTGGLGDVVLDIVLSGRSIPHQVEELGPNKYRVTYMPAQAGKYKVYVYFNGSEIRGSAFSMRVGSYRSRHHSSSRHNSELRTEHIAAGGGMISRGSPKSTELLQTSRSSPSVGLSRITSSHFSPLNSATTTEQWNSTSQNNHWANNNSTSHYNGSASNVMSNEPPWRRGISVYVGQGEHQRASPSPMRATSPTVKHNSATHLTTTTTTSRNDYFRSPSPMRAVSPQPIKVNSTTHLTTSSRNEYFRSPSPMRATSPPALKITPATPLITSTRNEYFNDAGNRVTERTTYMESRSVQQGGRIMQSPPPPPQIRSSPLLTTMNGRGGASPTVFNSTTLRGATPSPSPLDQTRQHGQVDTSSNVRVSSMLNNLNQRRDSWDAIAKTKSLLSYGSLESLANLTAAEKSESRYTSATTQHHTAQHHTAHTAQHHTAQHHTAQHHTAQHHAAQHHTAQHHAAQHHTAQQHHVTEVSNNHHQLGSSINSHFRPSSSPSTLANQVIASGEALKLVALHRQASIRLQTPGLDPMDVTASIKAPSLRTVPCSVSRGRSDDLTVFFTPTEIGEHLIELKVGDTKIPGSPFRTHAYNSQAIQVGRIPDGYVGKPVEFEIDGSHAGSGNLEILVNGGHVTSFVRDLGAQRFLASFVPHEAGPHLVEMAFNSEQVPGSPWQVGVMAATASSPGASTPLAPPPPPVPGSGMQPGKMTVMGDAVRLVACGSTATFELSAAGFMRDDIDVQIISPSKRPVSSRLTEQGSGQFRVQFSPKEVGSHLVEVSIGGRSMPGGPLVAKVYNAALIRVSDVGSGVVGQPCQFKVDASQAGEGQLEISVNEGEVPNHVAVVGGGRCLVSFTPEAAKPHLIDIKFNGEAVPGCPFVCPVSDTSRVSLTLRNLELIPVNETARFHIAVDGNGSAELAVSVRGPSSELPVKVTGNVHAGFSAEFTPREVGAHSVTVEYNGHPVAGTPFIAKAYDAKRVFVGPVPRGSVGKALQFTVDASQAGEGNLEITISARGHNIPTQVHPQGNARFAVSFIPLEATDHVISINFNKAPVPGSPFMARVVADPHHIIVSGQNLSSAAVGKPAHFTMSNVATSLDEIEVNVEGPNGQSVAAQVKDSGSQTYRIEFSPRNAGEHRISVAVAGQPVAGSPFACKAYDVKAIRVKEAARGSVGRPVTFLVETSQAGPGNLEVTVNGGRVPTSAQAQGPHTYAISFTPREATPHTVELRFNGEDVPGSPFTAEVVEAARIIPGAEEKVPVGRAAQFWLQAAAAQGQPSVTVLSPSRRNLPVTLAEPTEEDRQRTNQLSATFTPDEVGDHSIEVKIGETHVEGSPFLLKAYDATKVKVTDVQSGVVGKPVFFSINASQAGAGNLEIIVSVSGRNVPNYVQSEGNARFRVNFKPQEAAPHLLSVRFNGELVPGSPFTCRILDAGQVLVSGSAMRQAPISRPALLTIDPQGAPVQECVVTVLAPSGQNVPTVISGSAQDKFVATFTPFEVGRHAVSIVMDSEHVKGSPFACNVYDVSQVKVSGLKSSGIVGHPVTFSVDAAEAGEGTLELVVSTAQGTVKAEVAACARGLYQVTFVPPRADPHFVHISFNEDDVPGSPFECDIKPGGGGEGAARMASKSLSVRGEGLHQAVVGAPAFFDVDPGGTRPEDTLEVEIMGPDGSEVPVRIVQVSAGRCRAEYRPHHVGAHQVWVRRGGVTSADCPFEVEVFDPSQASITHVTEAICNQPANFTVDMSRAGRGSLSVSVKAAGRDVKAAVRDIGHGRHEVSFLPALATPHRVDVRLNGLHIGGCPMEIAVRDPVSGREILASGQGLYQAEASREASFTIETLGHSAREFDVVVSGPGGIAVPVRCYQQKDGNLLAQFTPPAAGSYKVEVLHGAKPLRSSPFFCQAFDSSRVRITGLGNKSVAVHDPISFQILRKGAGFAELDVTVISPLGQNLPLAVRSGDQPESDLIEFRPSAPGQYKFCIRYGGEEIPGSPVNFIVAEEGSVLPGQNRDVVDSGPASAKVQTNGTGEVHLSGPGLEGSRMGKETYFTIDGSLAAPGKPEASMTGEGGSIPIQIIEEAKGVYRASFTAPESGNYKLFVKWAGREVRGSPFSILVSAVADASRVVCSGEGLRVGTVGKEIRSFLDTRRAGPGELTAQCVGPNKVAYCELYDHGDGTFTLNVKPQEAGKHALSIKYGGQHVPGSPYTLRVAGAPDASKVRVFGPGIEHGVLATFQSRFVCDTRGAGAGQLTVRIRGPKGAFRVEMQRESQRDRAILCKYEPTEPGDYRLEVRWAGQHVPGSPFAVMIFDTQEELNRFVQGNNSPPGGPALSELYGSVGYSTGYAHMNFTQPSWRGSQAQL